MSKLPKADVRGCPHDNADMIGRDPATGDPVYRCCDCGAVLVLRREVRR